MNISTIFVLNPFQTCWAPWPVCRNNAILVAIVGGVSWKQNEDNIEVI